MLILSRVCADFHDSRGRRIFSVAPRNLLSFLEAPEEIREDPLFDLLLAEGSLEAVRSVDRRRLLEADPAAGTTAEGRRAAPDAGDGLSGSPAGKRAGNGPSAPAGGKRAASGTPDSLSPAERGAEPAAPESPAERGAEPGTPETPADAGAFPPASSSVPDGPEDAGSASGKSGKAVRRAAGKAAEK